MRGDALQARQNFQKQLDDNKNDHLAELDRRNADLAALKRKHNDEISRMRDDALKARNVFQKQMGDK